MASLNKVMLMGRLGADPVKNTTQTGKSVANFTMATSEKFKGQDGAWKETTEWHKIEAWDKLADLAENYLSKGSNVYIEGSIKTNDWTDKDGNKRYTTQIRALNIQFLDKKVDKPVGSPQASFKKPNTEVDKTNAASIDKNFIEDDIPF